jgi:tungstate transport system ATP-binding protein
MKRDAFDGAPVTQPAARRTGRKQQASGADSPLLFDLDRVCVRLGPVLALQDVSVRLRHGERVALVGANGCGKSTMLRLLNGLLQPAGGRIVRDAAARQALLFQRPYMLRTTARNNIALGLWMGGLGWADAKRRAVQALDRVGMAGLAGRNAKTLSGGQQQRLALARAWAASPDVLLLDEPTASLDPRAKHDVETLVAEFTTGALADGARRGPVSLVFASHNLGQVKRLATRVIYLEQGRVLADLPVDQFFNGPLLQSQYPAAHLFVKGELP